MKPRKPDRFERLVEKIIKSDEDVGYDAFCFPNDVITILRKEHAAVVRMVKAHLALWEGCAPRGYETNQYGRDCRAAQCREILDQLTRRAK